MVTARDRAGNVSWKSVEYSVAEAQPPAITLLGSNPMTVEGGSDLTDPGATAFDGVDGDLTAHIQVSGSVNSMIPGSYAVIYTVSNRAGIQSAVTRTVNVVDTSVPIIDTAAPSKSVLWPPNNKMVPVSILVTAHDAVDAAPACRITGVTSNETAAAQWQLTGSLSLNLRAQREGTGSGRLYTVVIACSDAHGNASETMTSVFVPHDQGK